MAADPLPDQVVQLRERAQEHKRQEGHHRRQARRTMAELRDVCRLLGIDFKEVKHSDRVQAEGQSHFSSD